ncbi:hypothetical protein ACHAXS_001434, partial [Conticribra weissflogii]
MYGLPYAGIMVNQLPKKQLPNFGYYRVPHSPSLLKNHTKPIQFTLVVVDFGIKYTNKK